MKFFFQVFVTLLVIMDPAGTSPVFLALTRGRSRHERNRLAWQAVAVAGGVVAAFALFGQQILSYLSISIPALQGSGGLLMLLVALELVTDHESPLLKGDDVNIALVPLGTPLIAGPGAIAATIVFVREAHGFGDAASIGLALVAVLIFVYLALRYCYGLLRLLRPGGIRLLTRIFGLLLSAIAVQLIADSVRGFVHS